MREIDVKCFQSYKSTKKEDKNFEKNESTDTLFVEIFIGKQQMFIYQINKKDQNKQEDFWINDGQG